MLFALHLLDREGTAELRQRVRPQHKAYLAEVAARIAFAGPLLADDGHTMVGSLLVMDFSDRAAVDAWLAAEPFTCAGLYAERRVHVFENLWPQRTGFAPAAPPPPAPGAAATHRGPAPQAAGDAGGPTPTAGDLPDVQAL